MKIRSIAALCRRSKTIYLISTQNDEGYISQWLGDGGALYPIERLPELDEDAAFALFDVAEKERSDWSFYSRNANLRANLADDDDSEKPIEIVFPPIFLHKRLCSPCLTSAGVAFIDKRYIKPLEDSLETVELYERTATDGRPYGVMKTGMILQAVFAPLDCIDFELIDIFQSLTDGCRAALSRIEAAELDDDDDDRPTLFDAAGK